MINKSLLVFYLILIAAGCSSTSVNYNRDLILPADRLIKKLEINRRKVKQFEGTGILKIKSTEFNAVSNFDVLVKKPDSIRISFYGPFGVDVAHVLIQKREVKLYDVLQNTLYISNRDNDFLYRLFKVDVSFNNLLNALIGSADMTERLQQEPDEYSSKGKYKLVYIDKVKAQNSVYFIDFEKVTFTKYFVEKFNGEKIFQVDYSDFAEINKLYFPNKINLINPNSSQELSVEYRRMKLNGEERNVRFEIPNNVNIIKLD